MYDSINAFGTSCHRGQNVRVAFDRNMQLVKSEKGAAFVLEFTLLGDGNVTLRQAGASTEEGLNLRHARGEVAIQIGKFIKLSELLRFQHGEISHPNRAGKLSFRHKQIQGEYVLSLHWEAGAVPVAPVAPAPAVATDFRPARGFDKIVAGAVRVQLSSGLWFPVFGTHDEALSFARYVGGFARRVAPGAVTRSRPSWSDKRQGFIARLSIQFPGWGEEEGVVLCRGGEVAGLALEQNSSYVLLPIKQYSHTVRTISDTLYVLFSDGTGFCRSKSGGAVEAADVLCFAHSLSGAQDVYYNGGALKVSKVPANGLVPIYISGPVRAVGDTVYLEARQFRRGTLVASVVAA